MSDASSTLRIDKWLWHARLAKTRSLAARLCALGAVELAGRPVLKPNQAVRVGAHVTVVQGRHRRRVEVLGLGMRRGPAAEAETLYRELGPPEPLQRIPDDWQPLLVEDPAEDEGAGSRS